MSETHYVAEVAQQGIFFDSEGRTLMLQYASDHGWWTFPGGRLRDGEDPDAGLVREVREETGLTVEVVQPVFTTTFEYEGTKKLGVASLCRLRDDGASVELSDEHRASRWVEPEVVPDLVTPPEDYETALKNAMRLEAVIR